MAAWAKAGAAAVIDSSAATMIVLIEVIVVLDIVNAAIPRGMRASAITRP